MLICYFWYLCFISQTFLRDNKFVHLLIMALTLWPKMPFELQWVWFSYLEYVSSGKHVHFLIQVFTLWLLSLWPEMIYFTFDNQF